MASNGTSGPSKNGNGNGNGNGMYAHDGPSFASAFGKIWTGTLVRCDEQTGAPREFQATVKAKNMKAAIEIIVKSGFSISVSTFQTYWTRSENPTFKALFRNQSEGLHVVQIRSGQSNAKTRRVNTAARIPQDDHAS